MEDGGWFRSIALTDLRLRVRDLERVATFYQSVLGFATSDSGGAPRELRSTSARHPLVVLEAAPAAPPRPRGTAGLFHVAFRFPTRAALASALTRVIDARVPIGSADHGVSEAIYLSDPEGNGIELYADRPPEAWPPLLPDGQVAMYTEPLDVESLLAAAEPDRATAGPTIGHVHLAVANLAHAERFYGDRLGFGVTQRSYPGALFLARDGYHHHIGANVWRTHLPAVPGAHGLAHFAIRFSLRAEFDAARARLAAAGHAFEETDSALRTSDLDGVGVTLLAGP